MKQLFFILSFFVAVSGRAQLTQSIGAPNTTLEVKGPLKGNKILQNGNPSTVPMVYDTLTGLFHRRQLGIWFSNKFKTSRAGNVAYAFDSVDFADDVWDKINEVATPGNYPTYPDFIDTTNNLRDAIAAVWANFSNYYTKTESNGRFVFSNDVRSITAADTTRWGAGAAPSADNPYRIDSTKILGEDNPRTLINYYHNGATSSTTYIDFKSDLWRQNVTGDLYHLGSGRVGLGTNAPGAGIEIKGNYNQATKPALLVTDSAAGDGYIKAGDATLIAGDFVPGLETQAFAVDSTIGNRNGFEIVTKPAFDKVLNAGFVIDVRKKGGGAVISSPLVRIENNDVEKFSIGPTGVPKSAALAGTGVRTVVANPDGSFSTGTGNGSSGASTLNDLTDVTIASPAANNVLLYDGTEWKNTSGTTINLTGMFVGDGVKYAGNGAFVRRPRFTVNSTGSGGTASLDSNANALTINFTSTTYTTTDNYLNVSGTTIATKKAWNTITWASSITVNAATSSNHTVTLGGTTTISISNPQDGQIILLELIQDATGSRTVTWPSDVDWAWTASGTAPTLKTAAGALNAITLTYKTATAKWYGTY